MLYLWHRFMLLFVLFVIDNAYSVLTYKDQGSHKSLSETESDGRFSVNLNNERRNSSIVIQDKKSKDEEGLGFEEPKKYGSEKKPRTFLGPLSINFKDKLNPKRGIIYDTQDSFGSGLFGGSSCCGSKYGSPSYSRRPEYGYSESLEGGRYPFRPAGRPGDSGGRPQTDDHSGGSGGLYSTRYGPPRGSYGGGSDRDRYGDSRPSYGGGSLSGPSGPSRPGGLYGRPSFGTGEDSGYGGSYGGSGLGGGANFGGGRPGGGYNGVSYGGTGPGSFGGGSYGGGGYGSFGGNFGGGSGSGPSGPSGPSGYGGFGSTDDFGGGGDYGYGEGGMTGHSSGGHLQTQKALALKALAGVALIGAAAALATNPVLLPLGVAHGRKKRSTADDFWSEHPLMLLKEYISQIPRNDIKKEDIVVLSKFLASRKCVARLACEVQREYFTDLAHYKNNDDRKDSIYYKLEHRFMDLVKSNVLNNSYVNRHLKKEIELALAIGAQEGNCEVFPCTLKSI